MPTFPESSFAVDTLVENNLPESESRKIKAVASTIMMLRTTKNSSFEPVNAALGMAGSLGMIVVKVVEEEEEKR
jgi:hypothetical protein